MEMTIGTPSVPFPALVDTGSNFVWTQCQPCDCYPQATPRYDPAKSTTFNLVACRSTPCQQMINSTINCTSASDVCSYRYGYADGSLAEGVVGTETLSFSTSNEEVSVPNFVFGCTKKYLSDTYNSTGIVGLGRGPLSLVSQLGSGRFSYCLTSYLDGAKSTSTIMFGASARLDPGSGMIQTTPLLDLTTSGNPCYLVGLEGIFVGGSPLPILNNSTVGSSTNNKLVVVDSGSPFTVLPRPVYDQLAQRIHAHLHAVLRRSIEASSFLGLDTCYMSPTTLPPPMPDVTFHFAGGAVLKLPREKYMVFDPYTNIFCLGMMPGDKWTILGNYQQQNLHVLFDTVDQVLSFVPVDCTMM